MKIIVGLGNPGEKYKGTRHNAGFAMLDKFVSRKELTPVDQEIIFQRRDKFQAEIAETTVKGQKFLFVKPETFMNLSGSAVAKIIDFYNAEIDNLLVCYDDVDLSLGKARIRFDGSSGGHKGVANIIEQVGSDKFTRIRIGISPIARNVIEGVESNIRPDTADFVLGKFNKREREIVDAVIDQAIEYVLPHLFDEIAMPSHTIDIKFDTMAK